MIYDALLDVLKVGWKRILLLVSVLGITIVTFNFIINNAVILVEVEDSTINSAVKYDVYANKKFESKKVGNQGLVIIPRSTESLTVSNGEYKKTRTPISVPFYGFTSIKVKIISDKNAIKIPFRSTLTYTCPTFEPSAQELFFYDCNKPRNLLSFSYKQNNDGAIKSISNLDYSTAPLRPFLGGVIGISYFPNSDYVTRGEITHVNSQGVNYPIPGPPGLEKNEIVRATIYTNTKNTSDNHFVIVDRGGTIFVGEFFSNRRVEYKEITAPEDYTINYNHTKCSFTTDKLYCYRGPIAYGEYPEAFDFSKVTQSQIYEYDLKNKNESIYKLTDNFYGVEEFTVTAKSKIYLKIDKSLHYLELKENKNINPVVISQNVDDIFGGDSLLYIQEKGVFVVDNTDHQSSHQLFYSPNVNPLSLYAPDGRVFLIGYTGSNKKPTYAYEILNENNSNEGKRLIDLVPIKSGEINDLYSSDLVNNTVIIAIPQYEEDESPLKRSERVSIKQEEVINYLTDNGYRVGSYNLSVK